jgi:WD40 repeat protein
LVTGSSDGTARVWDVATGQPIGTPHRHRERVNKVAFSPDGRSIVTASDDGTGRIWDVMIDPGSPERRRRLADLAEVLGGYRVTDFNSVVPLEEPERVQRTRQLTGAQTGVFIPE